jgi:lactoylglutathione lyase
LAFALDPDGYWVEIIKRADGHNLPGDYNLAQTMMRIKDPAKSLPFYRDVLGMKVVAEKHFPEAKFSLYFLANPSAVVEEASESNDTVVGNMGKMFHPVLELTHNHGTESDEAFSYHSGNEDPRGFGHIGFLVDNLAQACADLDANGVRFKKRPEEGRMRGIAFVYDPDGYWIEVIQRGLKV